MQSLGHSAYSAIVIKVAGASAVAKASNRSLDV